MTREQFSEEMTCISDLIECDDDYGLGVFGEIVRECDLDSTIEQDISDAFRDVYWYDIRDALQEIERGYDYYIRESNLEYTPISDSDFDEYYEAVLEAMIRDGLFEEDDDEDDEEQEVQSDTPSETPIEQEDITIAEMLSSSQDLLSAIVVDYRETERSLAEIRQQLEEERAKIRAKEDAEQLDKLAKEKEEFELSLTQLLTAMT